MAGDDEIESRVLTHLDELEASYGTLRIDPDLADTTSFCAHYGFALDESANCIVVASRDEQPVYAACLNLATTRLDVNKRVRRVLGVRKLSFASPDATRDLTGMMIGGVTPFGLREDLRVLVDRRVTYEDRVVVGGGSRSLKIIVDPEVFTRMTAVEVIEGLAVDI